MFRVSTSSVFKLIRRHKVLFFTSLGIVIAASALFALYYISAHRAFWQVEQHLSGLKDFEYQKYYEPHIDEFFRNEGIQGMIDHTIAAFASGQINMTACHSLAHDIGHYGGYSTNFPDIKKYLIKKNLNFCGSGFIHGVEGQLANEPYPQNADDLYEFCKMVQPFHPYYDGCYHGAGHSFKEETKDPNEALSWCDRLKFDDTTDPISCYRGVFSQNADDSISQGKGDQYLLSYCSSLKTEDLQRYCAIELNGLNLKANSTDEEITQKLKECTDPQYSPIIQEGCVRSITGVATDFLLGRGEHIVAPQVVLTMPKNLVEIYITSTYGAFIKTVELEPSKSLDVFCASFMHTDYYDYCEKVINSGHQ